MADMDRIGFETKWALRDLEDFSLVPWSGGDAAVSDELIQKVRNASRFFSDLFANNVYVPRQPVLEALQLASEDEKGYLTRIEELRRDSEIKKAESQAEVDKLKAETVTLTANNEKLRVAIKHAIEDLSGFANYGGGLVFENTIAQLETVLNETTPEEIPTESSPQSDSLPPDEFLEV